MPADDPFDIETLHADPANPGFVVNRANVPAKINKRGGQFIRLPWFWFERLAGATGQTYRVALYLLFLHWKNGGKPIKLANGMLKLSGTSRQSKWRALTELERQGLITVERRARRSPIVRLSHL
jgi:hypothetical protein